MIFDENYGESFQCMLPVLHMNIYYYFIMCNILHGSFQYLIGIHINSLIYCSVRSTTLNTDWCVSFLVYRVLFFHSGTWEVARADRRDNSRNQASPHRALQSPVWGGKKVHRRSLTNSICLTRQKMTTNLFVKIYVHAYLSKSREFH